MRERKIPVIVTPMFMFYNIDKLINNTDKFEYIITKQMVAYIDKYFFKGRFYRKVFDKLINAKVLIITENNEIVENPDIMNKLEEIFNKKIAAVREYWFAARSLPLKEDKCIKDWEYVKEITPHLIAQLNILGKDSIILAENLEVEYLTSIDVNLLKVFDKRHITLKDKKLIREIKRYRFFRDIYPVYVLAVLSVVTYVLSNSIVIFNFLIESFPTWSLVLLVSFLGLGLYYFRSHARLTYGLVECLIGIYITFQTFSYSIDNLSTNSLLKIALSLYIIVRGFDNIGKALRYSNHTKYWQKIFGKNY